MNDALTTWLVYTGAFCGMTWLAIYSLARPQARAYALGALVAATVASLPATLLPLSHAAPWTPPPGKYQLLGARIDVDVAIWIWIDLDGEPRAYRMPYTAGKANELQAALDDLTIGGEATATIGGRGGGTSYSGTAPDEGPVEGKPIEQPLVAPAPAEPN